MKLSPKQLASYVDHTLLKPESSHADVAALIDEAHELGVFSICISPSFLPLDVHLPEGLALATVCGFPSGAVKPQIKAREAALAVASGADEVDMVINIGAAKEGSWQFVTDEIAQVRQAMNEAVANGDERLLKVIIESAALSDDEVVQACLSARNAGANFVKTSTGFHPTGGASTRAISLMAQTVGAELGVKASGGIRTWADAVAMIEAGATRLGLSATRSILADAPQ